MSSSKFSMFAAALLVSVSLISTPASAQYQDDSGDADVDSAPTVGGAARLQVRINELEEQVRRLQGSLEQVSFSNRQLKTQMDKMKGDIDYRLSALEQRGGAPATGAAPGDAPTSSPTTTDLNDAPAAPAQPNRYMPQKSQDAQPAAVPNYASSHEHYSAAFKLLNQAKYAEAADVFSAFTQRYPKDPLIGNAFYWLGETYYVRKDYVKAADIFRQGYESMPTGPKASDNLLKLAMALSATGKDKESCIVLKQVSGKFGKTSASVKNRVEQEMNRIDCH